VVFLLYDRKAKVVDPYMSGANTPNANMFNGSLAERPVVMSNYYMKEFFGENVLFKYGVAITVATMIVMLGVVL
jgi:hypothetical protein